jgi:hypothetical protein
VPVRARVKRLDDRFGSRCPGRTPARTGWSDSSKSLATAAALKVWNRPWAAKHRNAGLHRIAEEY